MVNSVATALECVIADSNTDAVDSTHSVVVAQGDTLSVRFTPSTGTVPFAAGGSSAYVETNGQGQFLVTGANVLVPATGVMYCPWDSSQWVSSLPAVRPPIPAGGVIDSMSIRYSVSPGAAPKGYQVTLVVNGVDTALVVTASGVLPTTDTVHSVIVAPGDDVYFRVDPVNAPSASVRVHVSYRFTPTIDGESIHGFTSSATTSANTLFSPLDGYLAAGTGETARTNYVATPFVARKLHVATSVAQVAPATWTFAFRVSGVDSPLQVIIDSTGTTGQDLTDASSVPAMSTMAIHTLGANGPASTFFAASLVLYNAPPGSGGTIDSANVILSGETDQQGIGSLLIDFAALATAETDVQGAGSVLYALSGFADGNSDSAGVGVLLPSLTALATGESDSAGAGSLSFSLSGAQDSASDSTGSGTLIAAGGFDFVADSSFAGSGAIQFNPTPVFTGESDAQGSGSLVLQSIVDAASVLQTADSDVAGAGALFLGTPGILLSGDSDSQGAGSALMVAVPVTLSSDGDSSGYGSLWLALVADASSESDAQGVGYVWAPIDADPVTFFGESEFTFILVHEQLPTVHGGRLLLSQEGLVDKPTRGRLIV